jgi:SNF2 family DNA or RNA helicase
MEPRDAKGGILADDMGLGKTLVMLSTIAGSLGRARSFVSKDRGQQSGPSAIVPSRSTLVICPSSCKRNITSIYFVALTSLTVLIDSWVEEIRK